VNDVLCCLPGVARAAVIRWAGGEDFRPPAVRGRLAEPSAVFVTLRERETGRLRGCIGSMAPGKENLLAEVLDRAVAAAGSDPRFPKVRLEEIEHLTFEVNVLEPAEAVSGPDELDPSRYGVVVRDSEGRRGVLLPRIEGIDSVTEQIDIARRKAGIPRGAELQLERFRTVEIHEEREG
jgi:AmmeMemoRadiSam system protein A